MTLQKTEQAARMRRSLVACTAGFGILLLTGCSSDYGYAPSAPYDDRYVRSAPRYPYPSAERISCASIDQGYNRCGAYLMEGDRVRLVEQQSRSPCVRGRDWDNERGAIWVDNGCRATFEIQRHDGAYHRR